MPFVNLSWDVKTTKEKKRELMNFITDTIADLTSTDKNRIYVFIRDYDEENVGSPSCPVVQIDWVDLPARTPEVKAEITRRVQEKIAQDPNVNAERILVLFSDVPQHNAKIGL